MNRASNIHFDSYEAKRAINFMKKGQLQLNNLSALFKYVQQKQEQASLHIIHNTNNMLKTQQIHEYELETYAKFFQNAQRQVYCEDLAEDKSFISKLTKFFDLQYDLSVFQIHALKIYSLTYPYNKSQFSTFEEFETMFRLLSIYRTNHQAMRTIFDIFNILFTQADYASDLSLRILEESNCLNIIRFLIQEDIEDQEHTYDLLNLYLQIIEFFDKYLERNEKTNECLILTVKERMNEYLDVVFQLLRLNRQREIDYDTKVIIFSILGTFHTERFTPIKFNLFSKKKQSFDESLITISINYLVQNISSKIYKSNGLDVLLQIYEQHNEQVKKEEEKKTFNILKVISKFLPSKEFAEKVVPFLKNYLQINSIFAHCQPNQINFEFVSKIMLVFVRFHPDNQAFYEVFDENNFLNELLAILDIMAKNISYDIFTRAEQSKKKSKNKRFFWLLVLVFEIVFVYKLINSPNFANLERTINNCVKLWKVSEKDKQKTEILDSLFQQMNEIGKKVKEHARKSKKKHNQDEIQYEI